jgi:hypothetical protein
MQFWQRGVACIIAMIPLAVGMPRMVCGQRPVASGATPTDTGWVRLVLAVGPSSRDLRDYVYSEPIGYLLRGTIEKRDARDGSLALTLEAARFGKRSFVGYLNLGPTRTLSPEPRGATASASATWNPNGGSTGLTATSVVAEYRRYGLGSRAFAGGGVGLSNFTAGEGQQSSRALFAVFAGYAGDPSDRVRAFAEVRYEWTGIDARSFTGALSPRWFVVPFMVGASVRVFR